MIPGGHVTALDPDRPEQIRLVPNARPLPAKGRMREMKLVFVLDCSDPEALATFWTQALNYRHVGKMGPYVILLPDGWESPEILLQQVPEPKAGKNRMHLDIRSPDIYAE